jgi:hypothetical protein
VISKLDKDIDTLQGQHIANGNHYVKPKKWLSIVGMIDK